MVTILTYVIIPAIKILIVFTVLIASVAYLSLLERKLLAHIQVRLGPMRVGWHGLLQPIADGIKFLLKEDIIPSRADALVFSIAPAIALIPAFVVFSVVPFGPPDMFEGVLRTILGWFCDPGTVEAVVQNSIASGGFITDVNVGILFILAISSVGILGIILGGWASNSKYPMLGALRSTAQMVSYEVALGFSIIGVLLIAGSLSLVDIVEKQQSLGVWFVVVQPVAFIIFFICGLAETNRLPFDLPEAENELVAGFHTEYSGLRFAFFYIAEYTNMVTVSALAVTLFWGGWLRPFPNVEWLGFLDIIPPFLWFMGKVFIFLYIFIWIRGTLPRFRFDQLMRYGWKIFLPVALANVLVSATVLVLLWQ